MISGCSGVVLANTGTVLQEKTDAGRKVTLRTGRVPVDSLREAALMTMLAAEDFFPTLLAPDRPHFRRFRS